MNFVSESLSVDVQRIVARRVMLRPAVNVIEQAILSS